MASLLLKEYLDDLKINMVKIDIKAKWWAYYRHTVEIGHVYFDKTIYLDKFNESHTGV